MTQSEPLVGTFCQQVLDIGAGRIHFHGYAVRNSGFKSFGYEFGHFFFAFKNKGSFQFWLVRDDELGGGDSCAKTPSRWKFEFRGPEELKFPSTGRFRTTVAPAEFIITNEPELKAAFVFKSEKEVSELVSETLETAISDSIAMKMDAPCPNVEDLLAESADQRFRLRHLVSESDRRRLADKLERE